MTPAGLSETPGRPSRPPASLYVAGPFAQGYTEFYNFLIPLYGLSLGMKASEIGMLVGGRSLLAVFLSIHVGVLMDRCGTRRVTLFFVWTAMALAPVFPLVPWFWPLLVLQVVNGGALQFAWSGSQTLIAQLAQGEAEYLGRFSFFARFGTTLAPMIAGVAWDLGGAWPSYALGFAWGAALTWALRRAPEAPVAAGEGLEPRRQARFRASDALPRLPDYVRCFALMAIPAVATTMAIIFLRTATNGVQSSLYVVYVKGLGLTGTSIGILFAAAEIMSGLGALFAGRLMALGDPQRTMLSGTVASIFLICVTPFLGGSIRAVAGSAGSARLAARRRAADDVFGAGQGRRPASPRFCGRAAADDEPAGGDRDPAGDGRYRRPVGSGPELCHPGRFDARNVCSGHTDHPTCRTKRGGEPYTGRLTFALLPSILPADAGAPHHAGWTSLP